MARHDNGQTPTISNAGAKHKLFRADSRTCRFSQGFDLLLTSPPYYHPVRGSSKHGIGFTGELEDYVNSVGDVLLRCSNAVVGRRVCFVKTDLWYKGALIPVGWEIMRTCVRRGLKLRAHWIWQRAVAFSPYGPGFSNVFVFADDFSRPHFAGLITGAAATRKKGFPSSFAPELFGALIELLTKRHDAVLDPFAGAGGVIEAAVMRERRSVGVELSRTQFQVAVSRLSWIPGFIFKSISYQSDAGRLRDGRDWAERRSSRWR